MNVERTGTGIPMWVLCPTSLPQCFPIIQKRKGLPLENSLERSRGLCSALHCSLQLSRGSRSWRTGADGKLRNDCISGHCLRPDSSVWPGKDASGRRQKFPRAERPLTGMTDAVHTGSDDDDWKPLPDTKEALPESAPGRPALRPTHLAKAPP